MPFFMEYSERMKSWLQSVLEFFLGLIVPKSSAAELPILVFEEKPAPVVELPPLEVRSVAEVRLMSKASDALKEIKEAVAQAEREAKDAQERAEVERKKQQEATAKRKEAEAEMIIKRSEMEREIAALRVLEYETRQAEYEQEISSAKATAGRVRARKDAYLRSGEALEKYKAEIGEIKDEQVFSAVNFHGGIAVVWIFKRVGTEVLLVGTTHFDLVRQQRKGG